MDQPTSRATAELLSRAEETLRARRGAEVRDLLEALEWCDLNSSEPQDEPGALHHPHVLHQTGPGRYEWTTPHGLRRIVDRAGTHVPGP